VAEFLLLMHGDSVTPEKQDDWSAYLAALGAAGVLRGGSAMGGGLCERRQAPTPAITRHLVGYVKIEARDMEHARALVRGNPVYEAGGTVEIRLLPRTD
jgi:hypothetical protein